MNSYTVLLNTLKTCQITAHEFKINGQTEVLEFYDEGNKLTASFSRGYWISCTKDPLEC